MAKERLEYDVKLNTKGAETGAKEFKKRLSELNEEVDRNIDGVQALDAVTGGLASKVKDAKDQISGGIQFVKSFTKTFKGLRTAIIATGIGALVVSVGLLIEYWDQIKDFVTGTTARLKDQEKALNQITDELENQRTLLEKQRDILSLQGKSTKGVTDEIRKQLKEQLKQNGLLIENLQLQLDIKKAQEEKVTLGEKLKFGALMVFNREKAAYELQKDSTASSEEYLELQEKLNAAKQTQADLQIEILEDEQETADVRKQSILDAILLRDELKQEAKDIWNQFFKELGDESAMSFQEAFAAKAEESGFDPNAVYFIDPDLEDLEDPETPLGQSLAQNQAYVDARAEQLKKLDAAKQASFDNAAALFGAESAMGKAALVAKQVMMAREMILEAKKTITFASQAGARSGVAIGEGTAQTAKIGFPQNIPMLIAYAAQAAGIIGSIKSAISSAKGNASGLTSDVGRAATPAVQQAPAFNIVGATQGNQIAEAISGQGQRPVKTYVVAGDVTTAQELERKTVQGASIG